MTYKLKKRSFIKSAIGIIYEMAPNHKPRNIDKIVEEISEKLDSIIGKEYVLNIEEKDFYKIVKDILYSSKSFCQLNIPQSRWDKGVRDPFSKENSGISFVSVGHDDDGIPCTVTHTKDYYDFIDLGAAVGNIDGDLRLNEQISEDCFLCKYAEEYQSTKPSDCDICKNCICNPKLKYNREIHPIALLPRNSKEYQDFMKQEEEKRCKRT